MGGLGISTAFSEERNLEIIQEHYKQDPAKTVAQVNFLSHFTWVGHKKGENFPDCQCIRCKGLNLINRLKTQKTSYISEVSLNTASPMVKP